MKKFWCKIVILILMQTFVIAERTAPSYNKKDRCSKIGKECAVETPSPSSGDSTLKYFSILDRVIVDRNQTFLIKENDTKFVDSDIEVVRFTGGEVAFIPPEIYQKLSKITTIELNNTQTRTLDDFFGNARGLLKFKSYKNTIEFIGANTFINVKNLEEIELGSNEIININEDAFMSLTELKSLDLSNNRLDRIESGWFKDMRNLTKLNLENNKITSIDDQTFMHSRSLTNVNLRNNLIQQIFKNAFDGLNLKLLDLSTNACIDLYFYASINPHKYNSPKLLMHLILNWSSLNNDVKYMNIKKLPLTLAKCRLATNVCKYPSIPNGMIQSLSGQIIDRKNSIVNDETVQVVCNEGYAPLFFEEEDNEVTCIQGSYDKDFPTCNFVCQDSISGKCDGTGIGQHTVQLKFEASTLDDGNSYWKTFDEAFNQQHNFLLSRKHEYVQNRIIADYDHINDKEVLPSNLTYNERIVLQNMTVHYVPTKEILRSFPSVRSIHLSETNTQFIDHQFFGESTRIRSFACCGQKKLTLKANAFVTIPNLEFINIYCSNIVEINPKTFSKLHRLKRLYLEDNNLSDINPILFKDLTELQELRLGSNQITTISYIFFDYLNNVAILDFNSNKIDLIDLPSNTFDKLPKLDELNLSGNKCIDANFINAAKTQDDITLLNCFLRTCKSISNEAFKSAQLQYGPEELSMFIEKKCNIDVQHIV